jgi:ATP-dependent RNA helicase DDX24/MAK5
VAARGLDIPGVMHVIHYQVPRSTQIYVHRSGRTARSNNQGLSVTLVSPDEMNLYRNILKSFNNRNNRLIFEQLKVFNKILVKLFFLYLF